MFGMGARPGGAARGWLSAARKRLQGVTQSVRSGFWAVPTACVAVAVLLALGLVRVDRARADQTLALTFGAGPAGAREVLSDITSSMITFTGLVFSITIVVLQLTSSQFSPRVLRTFLRDRLTQFALGVFVATFVYAMLVLRTVSGIDKDSFVPAISTTVAVTLLLVSVGMFVAYIHHIATAIQVSSVITAIAKEARGTIDRRYPTAGASAAEQPPVQLGLPSAVLLCRRAGVVNVIDNHELVRLAAGAGVVLSTEVRIGDFVPAGAPLMQVHGDAGGLNVEVVLDAVRLSRDRTMQQDVAFGFRQLADIAARALSPGVNDPTTAVQALDQMHDMLRRLAVRRLRPGPYCDDSGAVRFVMPPERFADFLALALDEACQYGGESAQVRERVRRLVDDVATVALPAYRPALLERSASVGR